MATGWSGRPGNSWRVSGCRRVRARRGVQDREVSGGIGTLSEAALAWSTLQTEPVAADLIFLGAGWPPVLRSFADHLVIDDRDLVQVTVCADAQEAIAHITRNEPRQARVAGPRG